MISKIENNTSGKPSIFIKASCCELHARINYEEVILPDVMHLIQGDLFWIFTSR